MSANLPDIASDSSEGGKVAQTNQNFKNVQNTLKTNIIKDLTGTPRVLMGVQGGQGNEPDFYGIKVSQSGNDVTSAADDNLVMSSAFNMFKIVGSGEVTITGGATDGANYTETVNHALGYRPMVFAQVKEPAALGGATSPIPYAFQQWDGTNFPVRVKVDMFVDDADIDFVMSHDSVIGAEDFVVKYYMVRETGVS